MSASREKKLRQDQTASGYVDPKAEKELEKKKAEKRSNVLYSVIAVLFVLVVAASFLWRSNVISRNATALTIDGEKYSAAEVNFYYQNVYRGFLQSNSYFISYLGLDTNASLKSQTVNATAASMMGVEEGSSWHDYIMDNTVKQMTMVQRGLKQAQEDSLNICKSVPWIMSRELLGSIAKYHNDVDGIILLTAFPCGPDSMINEMIIRRIKDRPILNLLLDSQDGNAGIETRLESFIDIIRFRKEARL